MGGATVQGLGELESAIMQRLWSLGGPATGRVVYDGLREQRDSAYTTIMTAMYVLHGKGWLRRQRRGRAWEFEPTVTREEYLAQVMLRVLADTDDHGALFACVVERLSAQDSRALRAALRRGRVAGSPKAAVGANVRGAADGRAPLGRGA